MKKNILYVFVCIFLLSGCGSPAQNTTNNPAPVSNENDMQLFTNTKFCYSIEYPKSWFVDTKYSDTDFSLRGDKDYIGGDTVFSNYKNPSDYNNNNPAPANLEMITLMVYQTPEVTELEEKGIKHDGPEAKAALEAFMKKHNFDYDTKEEKIIDEMATIRLSGITKDNPTGVYVVNTLIAGDEGIYVINYSGPKDGEGFKVYNHIIDSFMMVEENEYSYNRSYDLFFKIRRG